MASEIIGKLTESWTIRLLSVYLGKRIKSNKALPYECL